jgi:hypothetical protein
VISLAQYTAVSTRSWAADSWNARVRLKAAYDQLHQEVALLREEMRIKDARMSVLPPSPNTTLFITTLQRVVFREVGGART